MACESDRARQPSLPGCAETAAEPASLSCSVARLPLVLGVAVALVAASTLAGWALDVEVLRAWKTRYPATMPMTAVTLLLQGFAVLAASMDQRHEGARWAYASFALAAASLGLLLVIFGEYATGIGFVDDLLFRDEIRRVATDPFVGRMSLHTAVVSSLTAMALLAASRRPLRARAWTQPLAAAAGLLVLLALVGHLHSVLVLFGLTRVTGMGLPTAVALLLVALAAIALTPERGVMAALRRGGSSGVLLRRLLVVATFLPLGLAVILRAGNHAGLYSLAFSLSVFVLLTLVASTVIAFLAAGVVARIEDERVERAVLISARAQVTAERDRAQALAEALRQNQAQLQAIVDHAPAAIYIKDAEGRLLLVNRHAEAAYAKPRGALIGALERELLPRETIAVLHAHDAIVRERGVPMEIEEDIVLPDGLHTYLSVKFPLPGLDGSPLLAGISTDITEKKRFEERREFLLALQAELLRHDDPKALAELAVSRLGERLGVEGVGLALVDQAAREIVHLPGYDYGKPPRGISRFPLDVCGRTLDEVREGHVIAVDDTRTDPRMCVDYERFHSKYGVAAVLTAPLFRNGSWVALLYAHTRTPHRWSEGEVALFREVADIIWPLYENARLVVLLRDAVRARDDFLSIASHELKTPLTPLLLRIESLERATARQPDSPYASTVKSVLDVAKRQLKRLTDLTTDLLDATRIQAGKLSIEREEVDLVEVVRDVCQRFGPDAARVRSPLVIDVPASAVGLWDRLRVEQIVDNLLSNALKYGPGERIYIEVCAREGSAILTVKDQGIGIRAEDQERISGRFERAVSERSYGGLGLGLHIVRAIVEAFGGTITVRSAPGDGATFTVTLPLVPANMPEA